MIEYIISFPKNIQTLIYKTIAFQAYFRKVTVNLSHWLLYLYRLQVILLNVNHIKIGICTLQICYLYMKTRKLDFREGIKYSKQRKKKSNICTKYKALSYKTIDILSQSLFRQFIAQDNQSMNVKGEIGHDYVLAAIVRSNWSV